MMTNPETSPITSNRIDTRRSRRSADGKAPMIVASPRLNSPTTSPAEGADGTRHRRYLAPMTTSVNSVIAAIDARRPGLKPAKKHLLLFFAQGHHLAWADEPLFAEPMHATDRGVALHDLGDDTAPAVTEAALGTITNVVIRYSSLSPADLRTLVQASTPWQMARKAGGDTRIEREWLADWFRRPDETDDPDDERPNQAERAEAEAWLASRVPD
jgi:uncharacterized phage-associated protein